MPIMAGYHMFVGQMSNLSTPSLPPHERLRVGECIVDVPLREVVAPGARRPRRITPKAMGVLRVLADSPGKVVSRDQLLAQVWPDTLPGDDVVTQAVTQLRKAFGERRDSPAYIETIAKSGYRLLAETEWLPASPGEHAAAQARDGGAHVARDEAPELLRMSASRQPSRWWLRERVVVVAVAVVAALALAFVLLGRTSREEGAVLASEPHAHGEIIATPPRPYRLLSSAPGFELSPTLSPDASMAAYASTLPNRRGTVIQVQTTNGSQPRQISFPPDGVSDRAPSWSPDGREIAYVRYGPGKACQVLVTAASGGGTERNVANCNVDDLVSFDWTPDSQGMVFGSMRMSTGSSSLRLLRLASGEWSALPGVGDGMSLDYAPRYSPDGEWIGFIRNPQVGDLWRVRATGGEAEQLTSIGGEFRGWDWLPDGSGMVFGRRIDSETRLYQVDIASGTIRDLGLDDAQSPSVARRAGVMAFVRRRPQFGLFMATRSDQSQPMRREHLFASSGRDTLPSLAPDGRQLVFSSDRSGHFHLWWADLEQPSSLRQVEGIHPATHSRPEWAYDSRRMLVVGHDDNGREGVYEVIPTRGQVSFLPMPGPGFRVMQAMYLPDPGRMLMTVRDASGKLCLVLLDRQVSPWKVMAKIEGVTLARVDRANERILFTRIAEDGLWATDFDLDLARVKRIDAQRPTRWRFQAWTVAEDGSIDYIEPQPDCLSGLRTIGLAPGVDPGPIRCLDPDHLSATTGFSASSRQDLLISAQTVEDGTDIGLMEVPEAPGEDARIEVPGWIK
ncbi:winged helix-turn-helix domain-containing protein [Marilutibacter spongiae]|uniref:PD40 domain-containing protein n=1 Tax=Marilutibacter spongiae TaxID=2025720 RepID=A0A7W3TNM0_9GAMM|nr:winged helix-turn-helix domain-containing protein [Lysobacter spongiae]MBB1061661.1 PD40 domain-containing protein [Lysobacter spongiae]